MSTDSSTTSPTARVKKTSAKAATAAKKTTAKAASTAKATTTKAASTAKATTTKATEKASTGWLKLPEVKLPEVKLPEVKLPEVDVTGITAQARDRVTGASKSVYGSVTHAVSLVREAVGI